MIITCENCKEKFSLNDDLIKESGSKVRCSKCKHVFTVYRHAVAEEVGFEPGLVEEVPEWSDELAKQPLIAEEKDELEEEGIEISEKQPGKPIDFDLFESKEAEDEETISLEDLGLEEETTPEEKHEPKEETLIEDEITLEDLGFEEGHPLAKDVGEKTEARAEDVISFDDLQLDEEPASELPPTPSEEWAEKEKFEEELEEEIDFEDLELEGLEDEELPLEEEPADEETLEARKEYEGEVELPEAAFEEPLEEDEELGEEKPAFPPMPGEEPPARKRISMPLLVLLVIVLVGGGAYAAYTVLKSLDVKIPFLESIVGTQTETIDPGNLHTTLIEQFITGEFVDSKSAGRLFVIKGKIRNDYPGARNFIRIKGALYLKDGKVAKDQIVYCGNVLSDTDLQTLDTEAIKKRLGNRFGDKKSNFRVPSGKILPFMVVFSDIPKELGDYSVEVVDSVSG